MTPLSFLARAAAVFPRQSAIIHGQQRFTYAQFYARSRALASALAQGGIGNNDTVSVMLANTPPMLEAHHGVPMCGAVLHAMNTRLDAPVIAYMLDHAETKLLIVDQEFSKSIKQALALAKVKPRVIVYNDPEAPHENYLPGTIDYEEFTSGGNPEFAWAMPEDEWDAISLNYTSGTTGDPKGVVYHHRGAHLMGYANVLAAGMLRHPVYLWTLPMFHCNGWCFPWTLSLVAGTHICLRQVRGKKIWDALADHRVTHLCGAPIVMNTILAAPEHEKRRLATAPEFLTAAAPPPESVLRAMDGAGFGVTHLYGLTETYGPAVVNEWHAEWDALDPQQQARKKSRQGVCYPALEGLSIRDPETLKEMPKDGKSLGEAMFRGNIVMKGYLKNQAATDEALAGGWFHSGDLGVCHEDGYIELKDRSKDIIISGGENISSIEIENILYKHKDIAAAAVVARPDEKWGETPCAFIELKTGAAPPTAEDLIAWCRDHMAGFKVPRHIVFTTLPRTSTGKLQKFKLRQRAKAGEAAS